MNALLQKHYAHHYQPERLDVEHRLIDLEVVRDEQDDAHCNKAHDRCEPAQPLINFHLIKAAPKRTNPTPEKIRPKRMKQGLFEFMICSKNFAYVIFNEDLLQNVV